ncbi:MAG: hypothetical protein M3O34_19140 [Chloroflexota bacterium]|nr:hypothetical protein [Chloroflexota bacterium]
MIGAAVARATATRRPRADGRLDAIMVAGCVWLSVGMAVDAWAHKYVPALETFFTPWHAVFYSGFAVVATVVGGATWRNARRGLPWRLAAPEGYAEALIGLVVFVAGALGDAVWHELFGVEKDLAALVSPTHLLLFAGITLFVTSPLRAAWRRADLPGPGAAARPSLGELMPAVLSVGLVVTMYSFVTQAASPLVEPFAARAGAATVSADPRAVFLGQGLGMAGFLVQTTLLVGGLLLLLRRWWLPFGAVTVLVTLNAVIQATLSELYALVSVALAAGLATDGAIGRLLCPDGPRWGLAAVAALLPTTLWGGYMLALALGVGGGLAWEIELVGGAVAVSAATGLLLSLLVTRVSACQDAVERPEPDGRNRTRSVSGA